MCVCVCVCVCVCMYANGVGHLAVAIWWLYMHTRQRSWAGNFLYIYQRDVYTHSHTIINHLAWSMTKYEWRLTTQQCQRIFIIEQVEYHSNINIFTLQVLSTAQAWGFGTLILHVNMMQGFYQLVITLIVPWLSPQIPKTSLSLTLSMKTAPTEWVEFGSCISHEYYYVYTSYISLNSTFQRTAFMCLQIFFIHMLLVSEIKFR